MGWVQSLLLLHSHEGELRYAVLFLFDKLNEIVILLLISLEKVLIIFLNGSKLLLVKYLIQVVKLVPDINAIEADRIIVNGTIEFSATI